MCPPQAPGVRPRQEVPFPTSPRAALCAFLSGRVSSCVHFIGDVHLREVYLCLCICGHTEMLHRRAVTVLDLPSGTRGPSRECEAGRTGHRTQNAETSHRRRPAPVDGRQPSRGSGCHWAPASSQPAGQTNEIPQTRCFGTTDMVSRSPGGCKSTIQVPRTQRLPRALCPEPTVLTRPVAGVCVQTGPSGVSACEDTDPTEARHAGC